MTPTFWESEVTDEQVDEQVKEQVSFAPQADLQPEPAAVALSANDFAALEERILRAVELVKRERHARAAAEERAARAEAQLGEQSPVVDQLRQEIHSLRAERDQVRVRVERLLAQLDALEI
ncbi:MAG TPA: hypothetical protein VE291_05070 [Terracidiphilus sp.]|jgi:uncharacterized coiled-coil protein SlyX|nr:hypothetical protein [Terracidiphilus sp.]